MHSFSIEVLLFHRYLDEVQQTYKALSTGPQILERYGLPTVLAKLKYVFLVWLEVLGSSLKG